jgi:phosphocarrier protein
MPEATVTLCNKLGLHARAAMKLTDLAMRFGANVQICKSGRCIDAKSIMEVMVLGAAFGDEVIIKTDGEDADKALEAVCALILDRFGEAE